MSVVDSGLFAGLAGFLQTRYEQFHGRRSGIDLACITIYKSSLPARVAELKAFDAAYTPAPD
jgi:hypothetical protein